MIKASPGWLSISLSVKSTVCFSSDPDRTVVVDDGVRKSINTKDEVEESLNPELTQRHGWLSLPVHQTQKPRQWPYTFSTLQTCKLLRVKKEKKVTVSLGGGGVDTADLNTNNNSHGDKKINKVCKSR